MGHTASSTPQEPIGSGYGAASTAAEVIDGIDLTGKVAIVTGGYSGIGVETVRALRGAGAAVIVPTRDHNRAAEALAGIDGVEIESMDLSVHLTGASHTTAGHTTAGGGDRR
ncbi:MAG: hypothetical protein QOG96_48, partial [Pseudonocardiales bacterium]|nr:hypothetical protein [Pseudonocardiales bacterium]